MFVSIRRSSNVSKCPFEMVADLAAGEWAAAAWVGAAWAAAVWAEWEAVWEGDFWG